VKKDTIDHFRLIFVVQHTEIGVTIGSMFQSTRFNFSADRNACAHHLSRKEYACKHTQNNERTCKISDLMYGRYRDVCLSKGNLTT
jgi:hypothetical protein